MAKILILDDDREICRIIGDMLEPTGAEILVANDGTEALAALTGSAVDLAIIDILFSGPVSSDAVVQHAEHRGISIITMSGTLSSDRRGRELKNPHLVKPFEGWRLVEMVKTALALRGGEAMPG